MRRAFIVIIAVVIPVMALTNGVSVPSQEALISAPKPAEFVAYLARRVELSDVSEVSDQRAPVLPTSLIIPPGIYSVAGRAFDMNREGIYRVAQKWGDSEQRIVFNGDVDLLMSSIAWLVSHGVANDNLSAQEWASEARRRKILIGCWPVSYFALTLIQTVGLKGRIVSVFTMGQQNGFDDGHAAIEVYRPELGQWVLYDLDNNVVPERNGQPLSLVALKGAVARGDYDFRTLASDIEFDVSNMKFSGRDFSFVYERLFADRKNLRAFYSRMFQAVSVFDGMSFWMLDDNLPSHFKKYVSGLPGDYRFLTGSEFDMKLYAPDG